MGIHRDLRNLKLCGVGWKHHPWRPTSSGLWSWMRIGLSFRYKTQVMFLLGAGPFPMSSFTPQRPQKGNSAHRKEEKGRPGEVGRCLGQRGAWGLEP